MPFLFSLRGVQFMLLGLLVVLPEVSLIHDVVVAVVSIVVLVDGPVVCEVIDSAVEAGSEVDSSTLSNAVPTVVGNLQVLTVQTGCEVTAGVGDVSTDSGGSVSVLLPCGDQLVGNSVGLSAVPVDSQRHVVLAVDLDGCVLAVGGGSVILEPRWDFLQRDER